MLILLPFLIILRTNAVSAFTAASILFHANAVVPIHVTSCSDKDSNGDDRIRGDGKKGYKFGDLTASIIGKNGKDYRKPTN